MKGHIMSIDLRNKYKKEIQLFVKVCHRLAKNMYVTGLGGNLAWRLEDDLILITPTQMNKGDITKKSVVFVNTKGDIVDGKQRPTGELPMYLKFFSERPDIVSVVHCHPPHVCAMAISKAKNWLMQPLYPECSTEIGPVPVVPYAQPLTEKLAQEFSPFLQKYNSFIMENHGLVTMSQGDLIVLTPIEYLDHQSSLGSLFFCYNKPNAVQRIYIIICSRVNF